MTKHTKILTNESGSADVVKDGLDEPNTLAFIANLRKEFPSRPYATDGDLADGRDFLSGKEIKKQEAQNAAN